MTLLFPKNKKPSLKEISTPAGYVRHVAAGLKLPSKAILCPISSLTRYVESQAKYKKYNCEADIYALQGEDLCYVTQFGSGAPGMTMALEVLIALGVKEFVFIGLAGSLQEEVQPAALQELNDYETGQTIKSQREGLPPWAQLDDGRHLPRNQRRS